MKRKKSINFTLKVFKSNQAIQRVQTHSLRRFLNYLRTINWQELKKFNGSVYLRVSYGKYEDNFGRMVNFYNDGWYETKEDLWLAFNAFAEKN